MNGVNLNEMKVSGVNLNEKNLNEVNLNELTVVLIVETNVSACVCFIARFTTYMLLYLQLRSHTLHWCLDL